MPRKLDGTYIQTGSITTTQLSSAVTTQISAGGGPRVSSLVYPGNDTAANTVGGQTVYIVGSGFETNNAIYINGNAVPSKSFISASNVSFTTPALSAGIYPVYFINTDTGATAIFVPGLTVSAEPTWVTGASLSEIGASDAWNISLSATGDAPITYALANGSSLPTGVTLAANGLISGTITSPPETDTTYTFTVVATDAQNQDSSRQFSITTSVGEGVLFANNVLLIHANGTNNQNNHAFLDSSNNNFTITRNGNATQGSFSPFSQTGWSNYFDGSGDRFTIANSSELDQVGDYCQEGWIYPINGQSFLAFGYKDVNNYVYFGIYNNKWSVNAHNTGEIIQGSAVQYNQWTHVALTRQGSTVRLFVNGVLVGSTTNSSNISGTGTYYFGRTGDNNWNVYGYMSNWRVTKGSVPTSYQTSSTSNGTTIFTPPSSILSRTSQGASNTVLLLCQSNRFVDNSVNNFTLSREGDVSIQAFSPFAPTAAYSTANVGGSGYFDGTGDYLSCPTTNIPTGNSQYTIECWYQSKGASKQCITHWGTGTNNQVTGLNILADGSAQNWWYANDLSTTGVNLHDGAWHHIVAQFNGTTRKIYVDGVERASDTPSGKNTATGTTLYVGTQNNVGGDLAYVNGYVSGLRIANTALYPSGVSVPTAPPTNVANTALLLNFTNAGIFDQTAKTVLETVGDAKITTSVYKYGTGSISYDGSGDYILVKPTQDLEFGSGDFTIEFWWYPTSTSRQGLYHGSFGTDWSIGIDYGAAAGKIGIWASSTGSSWNLITADNSQGQGTTTVSQNAWNHIAFVRSGTTWMLFVNGNRDLNLTGISGTIVNRATSQKAIGCWWSTGAMAQASGYMDDFRITKGYARYTSNFTAPTAAFRDK